MTNRFITTEYTDLKTQLADISAQMKVAAQNFFKTASKKIFEEVPDLAEIRWTQYTPYFNDGDSCEFSVHDVSFVSKADVDEVNGEIDDLDDIDWGYNSFGENKYNEEVHDRNLAAYGAEKMHTYKAATKDFEGFINSIDESIMESMFGDHVLVRITPEEVIIDEYEHD